MDTEKGCITIKAEGEATKKTIYCEKRHVPPKVRRSMEENYGRNIDYRWRSCKSCEKECSAAAEEEIEEEEEEDRWGDGGAPNKKEEEEK